MGCSAFLSSGLKGISVYEKTPNDQNEKGKSEKVNDAIDNNLQPLRQQTDKKLHLYMSTHNKRHRGGKGDGHKLGKHNHVNRAEDRHVKQLGSHNIETGNHHYQEERKKAYPLHQTANPSIESFKSI